MTTNEWYYDAGNNASAGPVTLEELLALRSSGRISKRTRVWTAGMENWTAYSEVGLPVAVFETRESPNPWHSRMFFGLDRDCPSCGYPLRVPRKFAGLGGICGHCHGRVPARRRELDRFMMCSMAAAIVWLVVFSLMTIHIRYIELSAPQIALDEAGLPVQVGDGLSPGRAFVYALAFLIPVDAVKHQRPPRSPKEKPAPWSWTNADSGAFYHGALRRALEQWPNEEDALHVAVAMVKPEAVFPAALTRYGIPVGAFYDKENEPIGDFQSNFQALMKKMPESFPPRYRALTALGLILQDAPGLLATPQLQAALADLDAELDKEQAAEPRQRERSQRSRPSDSRETGSMSWRDDLIKAFGYDPISTALAACEALDAARARWMTKTAAEHAQEWATRGPGGKPIGVFGGAVLYALRSVPYLVGMGPGLFSLLWLARRRRDERRQIRREHETSPNRVPS